MLEAKKILEIKTTEKISYREAMLRTKAKSNTETTQPPARNTEIAQIPQKIQQSQTKSHQKRLPEPIMIDAECQTTSDQSTMTETPENITSDINQDTAEKTTPSIIPTSTSGNREKELAFLIQVLNSIIIHDNISKSCTEISQAYEKQYNTKVDTSKVYSYYKNLSSKLNKTSSQGQNSDLQKSNSQESSSQRSSSQGGGNRKPNAQSNIPKPGQQSNVQSTSKNGSKH
jgi:hypothetical protein